MLRDVWVGICSLYYQIIENPRLSGSKTFWSVHYITARHRNENCSTKNVSVKVDFAFRYILYLTILLYAPNAFPEIFLWFVPNQYLVSLTHMCCSSLTELYLFVFTGASACVQLKKCDEAITWCDKGLGVSLTGAEIIFLHSFLTILKTYPDFNLKSKWTSVGCFRGQNWPLSFVNFSFVRWAILSDYLVFCVICCKYFAIHCLGYHQWNVAWLGIS